PQHIPRSHPPHRHRPSDLFIITSLFRVPWFDGMDNRPSASKVAIPRLGHDRKSPQNRHGKSRARKACDNCRKRKVKCSGEQPHCRNCGD
ncbi:uncharacterized protein K441DRAFT_51093, partial [Cenococcum geophilum 1.58]|uniref:uncharacterized protein n=1 Tax=Cenococcum geophilum 1.58 TaxID=794803 RepID=UPI00358EC258